MSSYMVDRHHVLYLVAAAMSHSLADHPGVWALQWYYRRVWEDLREGGPGRAVEVAQMLWDQNLNSIHARYPDTVDRPEGIPGPIGKDWIIKADDLKTHMWPKVDPVQVIKSCHVYEYQASDNDGWDSSEAFAFIQALKSAAMRGLLGYKDALYGAPEPSVTLQPFHV